MDRSALSWAVRHRVPHGGWCPRGRKAEDGKIPARFHLRETPSRRYAERTEWNVRDSDATVIFSLHPVLDGGSALTRRLARKYRKPFLHLYQAVGANPARQLKQFVRKHRVRVLNVAGPRESQAPSVGRFVRAVLNDWFWALTPSTPLIPSNRPTCFSRYPGSWAP